MKRRRTRTAPSGERAGRTLESLLRLLRFVEGTHRQTGVVHDLVFVSSTRHPLAALTVTEGRVCFGIRFGGRLYVDGALGQQAPDLASQLLAMHQDGPPGPRSVNLAYAPRPTNDPAELEALRRLTARALLYVLEHLDGTSVQIRQMPLPPLPPDFLAFTPAELLAALTATLGPPPEDGAHRVHRALAPHAEDGWLLRRLPTGGVLPVGSLPPSGPSVVPLIAATKSALALAATSEWLREIGISADTRLFTLVHADAFWTCAVGPKQLSLTRHSPVSMGRIIALAQRALMPEDDAPQEAQ